MTRFLTTCLLLTTLVRPSPAAETPASPSFDQPVFGRAPLVAKPYAELPLGAVKPAGWLRHQLQAMASGMTGHLDELYPQVVGPRNGWLGGDGDGWERGPYWIDGLLPLSYLLDDKDLQAKVRPWVEWTLTHQAESGYLGPVPFEKPPKREPGLQRDKRRDWWPKMVMLKILQNHYQATGDQRVITCLTKYFRFQFKELPGTPLGKWTYWGNRRGGDNLMVVLWLYNVTGEDFLLELAEIIHQQTYQHTDEWLKPDSPLTKSRGMHCVNIAQGMKHPVIYSQLQGDERHLKAVRKAFADLDSHWGFPTGLYGADEPLHSKEPTTGSEFCTAVEMMFSLEKIIEITGDPTFADRLERIAYNVLPTQATDDQAGRQYYSMRWAKDAAAIERGPLVYALRIGERWAEGGQQDKFGPYRECHPTDPWNYGLLGGHLDDLEKHFKVVRKPGPLADNPWTLDTTPIEIQASGKAIASWQLVNQAAAPLPQSPVELPAEVKPEAIRLIPFGATTLRITEFPVVR